jgi:electron transport complex protein RnfC
VQNVGTVFAVYEAVQKNKPLLERVVTVTGKEIVRPSNLLVRIGTPVRDLIAAAGGLPEATGKIIGGGPMMGRALVGADVPVTKGCSGILVMPRGESMRKPARNCIRCAKCVTVCPMRLNPALLMDATAYEKWTLAEDNYIADCIECGSCSYICPAHRPLLDYVRAGKAKVKQLSQTGKPS